MRDAGNKQEQIQGNVQFAYIFKIPIANLKNSDLALCGGEPLGYHGAVYFWMSSL